MALPLEAFKFKLNPGDWQHSAPHAGSLSITRGTLCKDSSFLLHNCKIKSRLDQRSIVKQKSEWKLRKTKVTAIIKDGCIDEVCTETKSWSDIPYEWSGCLNATEPDDSQVKPRHQVFNSFQITP